MTFRLITLDQAADYLSTPRERNAALVRGYAVPQMQPEDDSARQAALNAHAAQEYLRTQNEKQSKTKRKQRVRYKEPPAATATTSASELPASHKAIQVGLGASGILLSYALSLNFGDNLYIRGFFIVCCILAASGFLDASVFIREKNKTIFKAIGIVAAVAGLIDILGVKWSSLVRFIEKTFLAFDFTHSTFTDVIDVIITSNHHLFAFDMLSFGFTR